MPLPANARYYNAIKLGLLPEERESILIGRMTSGRMKVFIAQAREKIRGLFL